MLTRHSRCFVFVLSIASYGATVNGYAAKPGGDVIESRAYSHAQALITLSSGRKLNLLCIGQGSPTVIFEAGLGSGMMTWRYVQKPIATLTRACAYDRAGYGFSEPAARSSDAKNAVADLHDLLSQAGVAPPILLVGHSRGGQYVMLYAETYPRDVAGLVLVDPSFTGQDQALDAALAPLKRTMRAKEDSERIVRLQDCLNLAHDGTLLWLMSSSCLDNPPNADPVLYAELNREFAMPEYWATAVSERQSAHTATAGGGLSPDDGEMPPTGLHFGDMPVEVLTSEALASGSWLAGHDALAAASTHGSNIIVKHSGHYIQIDQPAAVNGAVENILEYLRQKVK